MKLDAGLPARKFWIGLVARLLSALKFDPCTITHLEGLEGPRPDGFPKVHSIIHFMISYMNGSVNLN